MVQANASARSAARVAARERRRRAQKRSDLAPEPAAKVGGHRGHVRIAVFRTLGGRLGDHSAKFVVRCGRKNLTERDTEGILVGGSTGGGNVAPGE